MGQGTYQSMAMLLAEELEVSLESVEVVSTDGKKKYGSQLSGGSSSVRMLWLPLRKAGAAAKEMLIKAAAQTWQVDAADCYAQHGKIFHKPTSKSLPYGDLVETASTMEVPQNPVIKDKKDFKLLGNNLQRRDIPLKVTGKATFSIDLKIEGMLYATLERSPIIHGKVVSFDDSKARAVEGVRDIFQSERPFFGKSFQAVAVVADNYFAATKARKLLDIQWDNGDFEKVSTESIFNGYKELAKTKGVVGESKGNFENAFFESQNKLEAEYETPFLAHAPMEPENAIVHFREDEIEIWAPIQGPDNVVSSVAGFFKIAPEKVIVHVSFIGGAFGRKAFVDYILEAALISKKMNAPIKLLWTREDDTIQGPFRPGALSSMRGALDEKGNLTAFQHKIIAPSIMHQLWGGLKEGTADEWAMDGITSMDSPYNVPNTTIDFVLAETTVPLAWWRSVYASTNMFGHECFVDEMAYLAKKDPLEFRLDMLKDAPRFSNVLQLLGEKSNWNQKLPEGSGIGIAMARSFETIVAQAVTVARDKEGKLYVKKVVSVMDCGMYVNPDNVKAQTEGNIIMGLTAALKDAITFEKGKTMQSNFHNYRMLRINEIPEMEIHIVDNDEKPGGVGEPGLPPLAPALCNAVFQATGKRIRKLPFNIEEL
jgi:isoquinoline 1-oxidoreductase subunit beta